MTALNKVPHSISKKIKAVIFDLDGTLVSSSLDFAQMRKEVGCPANEDILAYIAALSTCQQGEARAIVHQHEMADAQTVKILPGVLALLEKLSDWNIRTAIVTRNSMAATRRKLELVNLAVDTVLTRECAPAKPQPEALLRLCREWGIEPGQAIYVGDYLYDLLAAENAHMHSCLYIDGALPDYARRADFICDDYERFTHLLERYLIEL